MSNSNTSELKAAVAKCLAAFHGDHGQDLNAIAASLSSQPSVLHTQDGVTWQIAPIVSGGEAVLARLLDGRLIAMPIEAPL